MDFSSCAAVAGDGPKPAGQLESAIRQHRRPGIRLAHGARHFDTHGECLADRHDFSPNVLAVRVVSVDTGPIVSRTGWSE